MSVTRIPDAVLAKLRCRCGQFLSKPPISINNGQLTCSECTGPSSLSCLPYEALSAFFAFPCRYASQGCGQHVSFEEIKYHEAVCSFRVRPCPESSHSWCGWSGPLSQIYEHYECQHPELCVEAPSFQINIDESYEVYHVTKVRNILLLLQVKCSVKQDTLWFNLVYVSFGSDVSSVSYSVKLSTEKRSLTLEEAVVKPATCTKLVLDNAIKVSGSSVMSVLQSSVMNCDWSINGIEEKRLIKTECDTASATH